MEEQNTLINFNLSGISTEQYAVIPELYKEDETIGFNVEIKYAVNIEDKIIVINTKCSFVQNDIPFLIIEIANHFSIQPISFASFIDDEAKIITIPSNFAAHLVLLTIGTTRGVLHAKVENTQFNQFIIPTINLAELVKEPIVITY